MTDRQFPRRAEVERYDPYDSVGTLVLDTGERLRFGGSACKGFVPEAGMTVYVNAIGPHPLGGDRALIVRDQPISEEEAAERTAQARGQAHQAKLQPLVDAESRLPPMPLAEGFSPSLSHVEPHLPDGTRTLLAQLQSEHGALTDLGLEPVFDGSAPPWSFYDPSLWVFAIDGGGNSYALHYYPASVAELSRVPVVFWDHELHTHLFQAESLTAFLSGHRGREEPTDADWPLPSAPDLKAVPLEPTHVRERELVRQLIEASFTPEAVAEPLGALDALYQKLGWKLHLQVLRHQRLDWFAEQRRLRGGS